MLLATRVSVYVSVYDGAKHKFVLLTSGNHGCMHMEQKTWRKETDTYHRLSYSSMFA